MYKVYSQDSYYNSQKVGGETYQSSGKVDKQTVICSWSGILLQKRERLKLQIIANINVNLADIRLIAANEQGTL